MGPRGYVIDLDLAVKVDREDDEVCKDPKSVRVQTYFNSVLRPCVYFSILRYQAHILYQSMSVLRSQGSKPGDAPTPKQSLLDDAESFYYTLFTTLCAQKATGKAVKPTPPMFKQWGSSASTSAEMKRAHFSRSDLDILEARRTHSSWTAPTITALKTWHKIMYPIATQMIKLSVLDSNAAVNEVERLFGTMPSVWTQMLNALDVALEQLPGHTPGLAIPSTPSRNLFPELRAARFDPSPERPLAAYRISVSTLGTKRESEDMTPDSDSDSDDQDPGSPIKAKVKRLRMSQLQIKSSRSSYAHIKGSTGEGQSSGLRN